MYSARFSGAANVTTAGAYEITVTSDDGVRVRVDGKTIIDDWTPHSPRAANATVTLGVGVHDVVVEYFQMRGAATLVFDVAPAFADVVPSTAAPMDGPKPLFSNPVVPFDCPDPGVISAPAADGHPRWVMVCTGGKFQLHVSDDLVTWTNSGKYILPDGKAAWSANGNRDWAPEIHPIGSSWIAYFTAVNGSDVLSIGCAYASDPLGPFTDCGGPIVQDPLGVIDATFFEDVDGKRYLYWKIDGNSQGKPTPIFVRELASDGRSFAPGSTATQVLVNDTATWEGGVVEAPWIVLHDGKYFLFYSGNVYDDRYRTGVARASSPKGPFTKKGAPILANNTKWVGPGHGSVFERNGKSYFFHHAWPALANGKNDTTKGRYGLIAPIQWGSDGWPVASDGTPVTTPIEWP